MFSGGLYHAFRRRLLPSANAWFLTRIWTQSVTPTHVAGKVRVEEARNLNRSKTKTVTCEDRGIEPCRLHSDTVTPSNGYELEESSVGLAACGPTVFNGRSREGKALS
jgi:hypothetical protein